MAGWRPASYFRESEAMTVSEYPAPPSAFVATPIHWLSVSVLCLVLDYWTGPLIQFPLVYLVPISLASWYGGRGWGLALALFFPLSRLYFHTVWDDFHATRPSARWRHVTSLARVTASEFGKPAAGQIEARGLLGVGS